jgi:hypothetical protein
MREIPNSKRRLGEVITRVLNKIRKPSTAEEIIDVLNRELEPGDRSFQMKEVMESLQNASDRTLTLYWLKSRPPEIAIRNRPFLFARWLPSVT